MQFSRRLGGGVAALLVCAGAAVAGPYTAGNLVVVQLGDGSAFTAGQAAAVTLREWNFGSSTFINDLGLNSGASGVRLTMSNNATSEGALVRSPNGNYLTLGGYDAAALTAGVAATTSAATNRVAGRIDMNQNVALTGFNNAYSGGNVRGVSTFDGSQYWTTGSTTGVLYGTTGPTVSTISSTSTNTRVNYCTATEVLFSTGAGTRGIYTLGGLPTSGPVTATNLIATGASSSPYDFWFLNSTTCYIADDTSGTGGIQKWTFSGTWSLAYTISLGTTSAAGARHLAGLVDGGGVTHIYATTAEGSANRLVDVIDGGTLGTSSFSTLATAGTGFLFRGVEFAPVPTPGALTLLGIGGLFAARRRR